MQLFSTNGFEQDEVIQNPITYQQVLCRRRFMVASTAGAFICAIFYGIAVGLCEWVYAELEGSLTDQNDDHLNVTIILNVGIWYEHRISIHENKSVGTWIPHFPKTPDTVKRLEDEVALPHYYRVQAVFSFFSLGLMIAGIMCALYSFRQQRYMYKRLTAGLFAFSAFTNLVVIEVMLHHMNKWKLNNMSHKGRPSMIIQTHVHYGFSTIVAWFVFAFTAVTSIIFIIGSRKQKGEKAATQQLDYEDRNIELRR